MFLHFITLVITISFLCYMDLDSENSDLALEIYWFVGNNQEKASGGYVSKNFINIFSKHEMFLNYFTICRFWH